jgi:phospholipid transport system substrate-binding protein
MKRFFVALIASSILMLNSNVAMATWQEASVEVQTTIEEMIAVVDKHKAAQTADVDSVAAEIEAIVDRDVDFEYLSKWVMGKYYRQATEEERKQFAVVFKQTMIKTYTKSLLEFDIASYKLVEPTTVSPEDDKQIVSVDVTSGAGTVYTLVNYMAKENGSWKLVNVMLNGINLRITFKNQFADMMQRLQYDVGQVVNSWQAQIDNNPVKN